MNQYKAEVRSEMFAEIRAEYVEHNTMEKAKYQAELRDAIRVESHQMREGSQ